MKMSCVYSKEDLTLVLKIREDAFKIIDGFFT